MVIDNVAHLSGGAGISFGYTHDGVIEGNDARFNPGSDLAEVCYTKT
jgi:parallel beta-helix repeat protein